MNIVFQNIHIINKKPYQDTISYPDMVLIWQMTIIRIQMSFLPYLCEPPLHKGVQDNHAYILRIKQLDKLELVILSVIFLYPTKPDNQLSITSLFDKAFKALFELVWASSCRINVSNANAFV